MIIRPSSLDRSLSCTASPSLIDSLPPELTNTTNDAANEGTTAHALAEYCLNHHKDANEINFPLTTNDETIEYNHEMINGVQMYLTYINNIDRDNDVICEMIERYTYLVKVNVGGTFDYGAIYNNTLEIVDFKYGKYSAVDVINNPQLLFYALSLYTGLTGTPLQNNVKEIKLTIVQPRAEHPDGPIRSHVMSINELLRWYGSVLQPALINIEQNPVFNPSDKNCLYCPAKAFCKSYADFHITNNGIKPAALLPANLLTLEEADDYYQHKKKVFSFYGEIEKRLLHELTTAKNVDHLNVKLVSKQSRRSFNADDQTIITALESVGLDSDDFMVNKKPALKSVAQIEKLLYNQLDKKTTNDFLNQYAVKKSTGTTLALKSDKKEQVYVDVRQEFASIISDSADTNDADHKTVNQYNT